MIDLNKVVARIAQANHPLHTLDDLHASCEDVPHLVSELVRSRAALADLREAAIAYRRSIELHAGDDYLSAERRGPRMALDDALYAARPDTRPEAP